MTNIFRETFTSVQDSHYGEIIIHKPLKQVIWYWTKYLLLVAGALLLFGIFTLTHKLPQLPKFIDSTFPDGRIDMRDGVLSSTIRQPYIFGDTDFSFIFDTAATSSALDTYRSGILIASGEAILKSETGALSTQSFTGAPSFSFSKSELSGYISSNFPKVWAIAAGGLTALTLLITSLVMSQKFISYIIWTAIFYLITKYFLKKSITPLGLFKLVIYASIIPMLFSVILSFSPNPILDILNLAIMAYFTFNWIWNLPVSASPVANPLISPPPTPTPARKRKKAA